jgi:hypothetical protein
MEMFPHIQFYDYTKVTKRALAHAQGKLPKNYHLTFSLSEDNDSNARAVLGAGGNVAAVFHDLPHAVGHGYHLVGGYLAERVTNGDDSDLRFLDLAGVIVGLKAKGKARKDTSGFVR